MSFTNIALIAGAIAFALVFFQPRLLRAPTWQATVTPLASIIGSGFLVAGPILAAAAGPLATLAMFGLCVVAYLFGSAIRHNIVHIEQDFDEGTAPVYVQGLERTSEAALSVAYFVSVAYYLNLFAAFGLRLLGSTDPFWISVVSTVVIAIVGVIGAIGGLDALERVEIGGVALKLSLIGGVLVGLVVATVISVQTGTFNWDVPQTDHGWHEIQVLLGLVILVQGFETSRYLGAAYDAETRVKTMRWAQWLSTGIYIVFILLATSYFRSGLPHEGGETAIIDILRPIGWALAPMIIAMALASQLSAAVADMNGAGGLIAETSGERLSVKMGNALTAIVAIAITWFFDIYQIIAYASKVFVAYYALQALQAAISAWKVGKPVRAGLYALGVVLALIVVVFAIPADA